MVGHKSQQYSYCSTEMTNRSHWICLALAEYMSYDMICHFISLFLESCGVSEGQQCLNKKNISDVSEMIISIILFLCCCRYDNVD